MHRADRKAASRLQVHFSHTDNKQCIRNSAHDCLSVGPLSLTPFAGTCVARRTRRTDRSHAHGVIHRPRGSRWLEAIAKAKKSPGIRMMQRLAVRSTTGRTRSSLSLTVRPFPHLLSSPVQSRRRHRAFVFMTIYGQKREGSRGESRGGRMRSLETGCPESKEKAQTHRQPALALFSPQPSLARSPQSIDNSFSSLSLSKGEQFSPCPFFLLSCPRPLRVPSSAVVITV